MSRAATRHDSIIGDGSKRKSYHRPDPLADGVEPACNTARQTDGGWRAATAGELTFLDPCGREECFGAGRRHASTCPSCEVVSRDCYRCEHCGRDLADDRGTEGRV